VENEMKKSDLRKILDKHYETIEALAICIERLDRLITMKESQPDVLKEVIEGTKNSPGFTKTTITYK
jgi:hypothetical protein